MRATRIPALFLGLFAMVVIGCGSRSMSQTIYRTQVSQQQLLQDVATLRRTSGVENVTYTHDVTGAARMVVTYEPSSEADVINEATTLGYKTAPQ